MRLTVRDAASALSIAKTVLERAVDDGSLRAYELHGRYWLHRAELLEWATAAGVTVPPALIVGDARASVAAAIEAGGVQHDVRGSSPREILHGIVHALSLPEGNDRDELCEMLARREAQCSIAVGHGIALPHVRGPMILGVARPVMALAYLARPVDFGAIDGRQVSVVFAFVSPTIRVHHRVLSSLAYLAREPRMTAALDARAGAEIIVPLARTIEGELEREERGAA